MNEYSNHVNKFNEKSRISSSSFDENLHSNSNGTYFSSQTFVDDIPFEFNSKYRIIHVPNIQLPDYDTQTIQNLLSTSFDFSLENRVLEEAIEDVQRKKKEIEADSLAEPISKSSKTSKTNCQVSDSSSISPSRHSEPVPLPIVLPTIAHPPPPPLPVSSVSSTSSAIVSLPSSSTVPSFPSIHPSPSIPSTHSTYSSPSNSYRLPSVRDIYWPTTNQQQYQIPPSTGHSLSTTSNHYPIRVPPTSIAHPPPTLRLPPPSVSFNPSMISKPMTTTITPSTSSGLTPTPTTTSTSMKNSINTNELAVTFDQTLTSDDPFHDAELKSLNDVVELNHLYSAFGSANTVRR